MSFLAWDRHFQKCSTYVNVYVHIVWESTTPTGFPIAYPFVVISAWKSQKDTHVSFPWTPALRGIKVCYSSDFQSYLCISKKYKRHYFLHRVSWIVSFFEQKKKQQIPSHVAPTVDFNTAHVCMFGINVYVGSFLCQIF